jgi:hypothetical protein
MAKSIWMQKARGSSRKIPAALQEETRRRIGKHARESVASTPVARFGASSGYVDAGEPDAPGPAPRRGLNDRGSVAGGNPASARSRQAASPARRGMRMETAAVNLT